MKLRHAAALALGAFLLAGCAPGTDDGIRPPQWVIMSPPAEGDTAPLTKWKLRNVLGFQTKELCEDGIADVRNFDRREGLPPTSIYGSGGEYVCVTRDDSRLANDPRFKPYKPN
jgi:hypothetical protein